MPVIRVREETWEMMKNMAKPFEKPDELVSRAMMALAEKTGTKIPAMPSPKTIRQPRNEGKSPKAGGEEGITRQELKDLIEECLREVGGSAEKQYVERWIEERLGDRLTPYHWQSLNNEIRWKKWVQFARNELREAGVIKSRAAGGRDGLWELASA